MNNERKTIAITGGTKGMGRAIAELFGKRGWQVTVSARSTHDLDAMRNYWEHHMPHSHLLPCTADLSRPEGCASFIESVHRHCDRLELLVNNVGIFHPGNLRDSHPDVLEQFLKVNLLAAHRISLGLLPQLLAAERSHLITIGSVAVTDWPAGNNLYSISKYALYGWQKALRQELADTHLKVSLITPGATRTASWENEEIPLELKLLSPETIADTVAHIWDTNEDGDVEEIVLRP